MAKPPTHSPLDSLVDLACRDGVDIRPTLLRVITDLYVQKPRHSAEEETQYVELALGLVGAVDATTRTAVAARLGDYANAPRSVLQRLAAPPVQASTTPQAQPQPQIQPKMQAAPPMPPASAEPWSPSLAPASAQELIELFFSADPEERRLILINLDVVADPVPRPPATEAIIRRLESTALQRNVLEFARMLERGLSIGRELATRITHDPSGEGIVVAAKALGMKADVLQRILLFLNPAIGQSVSRVFELAQLYEDMTWGAAASMAAIWRQPGERLRPRHAPALWDDERSRARARATPAHHRGLRNDNAAHPPQRTSGTSPR